MGRYDQQEGHDRRCPAAAWPAGGPGGDRPAQGEGEGGHTQHSHQHHEVSDLPTNTIRSVTSPTLHAVGTYRER